MRLSVPSIPKSCGSSFPSRSSISPVRWAGFVALGAKHRAQLVDREVGLGLAQAEQVRDDLLQGVGLQVKQDEQRVSLNKRQICFIGF